MAFRSCEDWCWKANELPERHDVLLEGFIERELVAPDGSVHRVKVPQFSPPIRQLAVNIRWGRVAAAAAAEERDKAA